MRGRSAVIRIPGHLVGWENPLEPLQRLDEAIERLVGGHSALAGQAPGTSSVMTCT